MKMDNKSRTFLPMLPFALIFSNMQSMGATTRGIEVSTKDVYRQRAFSEWVGK